MIGIASPRTNRNLERQGHNTALEVPTEMSDAAFQAMLLSLHPVYPTIIDPNGDFIHHVVIRHPEQRVAHKEELQVASLKDRAATYAKAVIDKLDMKERIQAAAPTMRKRRVGTTPSKNANPFSYVFPRSSRIATDSHCNGPGAATFSSTARAMARR